MNIIVSDNFDLAADIGSQSWLLDIKSHETFVLITSCISGQRYKNRPVCVCVWVCVLVCEHSDG